MFRVLIEKIYIFYRKLKKNGGIIGKTCAIALILSVMAINLFNVPVLALEETHSSQTVQNSESRSPSAEVSVDRDSTEETIENAEKTIEGGQASETESSDGQAISEEDVTDTDQVLEVDEPQNMNTDSVKESNLSQAEEDDELVFSEVLDDITVSFTDIAYALQTPSVTASDYVGTVDTANQWQIVAEQYGGSGNTNKIGRDINGDGVNDIWIQKSVIPTGTENQFRVYLSETIQMTWDDLLSNATLGLTTQGKWKTSDIGSLVNLSDIGGNKSNELQPGKSSTGRNYYATIYLERGGSIVGTYEGWFNGTTPNASNCTGYIILNGVLSNRAIIASVQVNLHNDGNGTGGSLEYTIDLDTMAANKIYFSVDSIELDTVTDQLGDYMIFDKIEKSDGDASYTETNPDRTITWYPDEDIAGVTGETISDSGIITGYQYNVCQMVYDVTLDVTKAGFDSCADNMNSAITDSDSYAVNNYATLAYHAGSTSGTMDFQKPYVRGLLYDIDFNKTDEDGAALKGARFGLYQSDGTTLIQEIETDGNITHFTDLPYGDYILKEISPPTHYSASTTTEWNIRLCYTDSATDLEQDLYRTNNMRYKGNDTSTSRWDIVNTYIPIKYKVQIIKTDDSGGQLLEGAEFSVTDPDNVSSGRLTATTDQSGTIEYAADFNEDVEYTLTEVSPPDGYSQLMFDIKFKVTVDKNQNYLVSAEVQGADNLSDFVTYELVPSQADASTYILKMTVKNQSGDPLPLTGGNGGLTYRTAGLLIVLATVVCGYVFIRRRGRREQI